MRLTTISLTLIVFALFAHSCKKDEKNSVRFDRADMYHCTVGQNFDSSKLANSLLGTWQWDWTETPMSYQPADRVRLLKLSSNGEYSLTDNSVVVLQGTWLLFNEDKPLFGLLTQPSAFFYGRIELCNDQLYFDGGYRDGSNVLFHRVQ